MNIELPHEKEIQSTSNEGTTDERHDPNPNRFISVAFGSRNECGAAAKCVVGRPGLYLRGRRTVWEAGASELGALLKDQAT